MAKISGYQYQGLASMWTNEFSYVTGGNVENRWKTVGQQSAKHYDNFALVICREGRRVWHDIKEIWGLPWWSVARFKL